METNYKIPVTYKDTIPMKDYNLVRRGKILLSTERALVGYILPNLRCVVVDWNDNEIFLYFVFDGNFSEDDQKVMEHVAEAVLADFPGGIVKPQFLNIPYPQRFSSLE